MLFFMSKISCFIQNIFYHRLAVNKLIKISPEPIKMRCLKTNKVIDIPIPSSHLKTSPISCRLLSATKRCGMVGEHSKHEMSKNLIIHVHGGVSKAIMTLLLFVFLYRNILFRVSTHTHLLHVSQLCFIVTYLTFSF